MSDLKINDLEFIHTPGGPTYPRSQMRGAGRFQVFENGRLLSEILYKSKDRAIRDLINRGLVSK